MSKLIGLLQQSAVQASSLLHHGDGLCLWEIYRAVGNTKDYSASGRRALSVVTHFLRLQANTPSQTLRCWKLIGET